jgi:hypothetical protein
MHDCLGYSILASYLVMLSLCDGYEVNSSM